MKIQSFVFNGIQENTYVLFDDTKECVIIDAGCYDSDEQEELSDFIRTNNLKPVLALNTHSHIDHVLGNFYVKKTYQIPLLIHTLDEQTLRAVKTYAPMYGFPLYQEQLHDGFLKEGISVKFGTTELEVLFVPGHAPGHVAFFHRASKSCIAGDVLFQRSIGRTDLPGGNLNVLMNSIHKTLFPLGDDVKVYPGHGPTTTIGNERTLNPYITNFK